MIYRRKKWKGSTILLLDRLYMYMAAGLPVVKALSLCSDGSSQSERFFIQKIRESVLAGSRLSEALGININLSSHLTGLIEQGEKSGELPRAILAAKSLLDSQSELKKKCLGALLYPMVIGAFSILLTVGLMKGIMPQIIPMLRGLNVDLPLVTVIVIAVSDFVSDNFFLIMASIIIFASIFSISRRKSEYVRSLVQTCIWWLPWVGKLVYKYHLSIFLFSFGTLVESGCRSLDASESCVSSLSFRPLKNTLRLLPSLVREGKSIGGGFDPSNVPPYVVALIKAGEFSGTLGGSILKAGDIVGKEIDLSLKKMTSLIEPVMMIGLGSVVGTIALSIMLPIYDLSKALQR